MKAINYLIISAVFVFVLISILLLLIKPGNLSLCMAFNCLYLGIILSIGVLAREMYDKHIDYDVNGPPFMDKVEHGTLCYKEQK